MTNTPQRKFSTYRDLKVWDEGTKLYQEVIPVAQAIAKKDQGNRIAEEILGTALAFPIRIAEAYSKRFSLTDLDFHFNIALDYLDEIYTLIQISEQAGFIKENKEIKERLIGLMKMTGGLKKKIKEGLKSN